MNKISIKYKFPVNYFHNAKFILFLNSNEKKYFSFVNKIFIQFLFFFYGTEKKIIMKQIMEHNSPTASEFMGKTQ